MWVNTGSAEGVVLDYIMAQAAGQPVYWNADDQCLYCGDGPSGDYEFSPTTRPEQAHLILDKSNIQSFTKDKKGDWTARTRPDSVAERHFVGIGESLIEAGLRCAALEMVGEGCEVPAEIWLAAEKSKADRPSGG